VNKQADQQRLKVLMIGEYPARPDSINGGVAAVVTYLSEALAARADIELYGVRVQGEHGADGKAFGYPVYDIPKGSFGLASLYTAQRRRLEELVKYIKPDIILFQPSSPYMAWLAKMLASRLGCESAHEEC
jgi:hypothetical protein